MTTSSFKYTLYNYNFLRISLPVTVNFSVMWTIRI